MTFSCTFIIGPLGEEGVIVPCTLCLSVQLPAPLCIPSSHHRCRSTMMFYEYTQTGGSDSLPLYNTQYAMHGSSSSLHMVQPLTWVGAWTLLIMWSLWSFYKIKWLFFFFLQLAIPSRVINFLIGLGRARVPGFRMAFYWISFYLVN